MLIVAFVWQIAYDEPPCPLCLLQRVAFMLAGVGLLLNLRLGPSPMHYAMVIAAALGGMLASGRQVLLHIAPGDPGYGTTLLGLHFYTWSFIAFVALIAFCVLMLSADRKWGDSMLKKQVPLAAGSSWPCFSSSCWSIWAARRWNAVSGPARTIRRLSLAGFAEAAVAAGRRRVKYWVSRRAPWFPNYFSLDIGHDSQDFRSGAGHPVVGVIMGSSSDWEVMKHAVAMLEDFGVPYEAQVISAHRMPQDMAEYGAAARARPARHHRRRRRAHLPGMMAALTEVPVFGVPVPSKYLRGEDSLLSIVQMPGRAGGHLRDRRSRRRQRRPARDRHAGRHGRRPASEAGGVPRRQTQAARDMKVPPEA